MKEVKLFFVVLALMAGFTAAAQSVKVTGKVTDSSNNEPVSFASIQLKGTMTGGSTLADGTYTITVPSNGVLIFSSIGYKSVEVNVAGKAVHNVILEPDSQVLDETIVVAFGTATKESFTGSATVVDSKKLEKIQTADVTRAIEGSVAGVQMTTSSGTLGSSPSIIIRGIGSISAGSSPLYVVDGVPYPGDMNNINPADIESVTVLKDAASNALYGARGANGVIMITTKKAKAGEAVVNVDAKWGLNTKALKQYDFITDPALYYETHYNALKAYYRDKQGMSVYDASALAAENVAGSPDNGGLGYLVYTVPEGEAFIGTNGKLNPNATMGRKITVDGTDYWLQGDDWMKEAYRQSFRQEYNVSVSGTTGKASVLASFGYLNDNGIIAGADMQRYTARLKADYQAKPWLKIGANASYSHYSYNNGNSDEGSAGSTGNIFSFASSIAPIYPVYLRNGDGSIMIDSHGYKMYDFGDLTNSKGAAVLSRPASASSNALQLAIIDRNNSEGNAFNGTGYTEISFLKDFKFTFNVGVGLDETRGTFMNNPYYGQYTTNGGLLSKSHGRIFYLNLQQLLSWQRTFDGVHHVSAMLGHEWYDSKSYSLSAYKTNLFSIDNLELNGVAIDGKSSASSQSEYNNEGYFFRGLYDYDNRIFASVSYRRDASSRFSPSKRWGNFWSLGAGWLINKESWFNAPWVDMLKLKASIGSQGNDNIGSYRYTDTFVISNNNNAVSVAFGSKGNENITWETNTNFNTGVDFELFDGRLGGGFEYFYRKTSDMLFFFTVPASLGYSGYYDNVGDMRNRGLELVLNGQIIRTKDLVWDAYFNITHYTNKILRIPEGRKNRYIEGHGGYASGNKFVGEGLPYNTFFLAKYAGVDHSTGLPLWYKDEHKLDDNGDEVLDEHNEPVITGRTTTSDYSESTQYLCDDPTPKAYGGFGTSLYWKGFDLSVSFTYSLGGLVYDSGYAALVAPPGGSIGFNFHKDVLKAWTPENPESDFPRFQYLDQNINGASDRFLVPASYLNFQNAQIGYTIPQRLTAKAHISRLRVFLTCDNIIYWSYRNGLDSRYSFSGSSNDSVNSPVRVLSGGINITF
ncbi:MAG: TonB-dependent receptor [Bacteroidales bacterium]|nr:TonB-dependent receptor [Bacteroidales bacterium]